MPDSQPSSHLGLYRAGITGPEHRRHITVGRAALLQDTVEILRKNGSRKPRHHQLFIGPRGIGKTHLLSMIEDAIRSDAALGKAYHVARFPEESNRTLSFADFLLGLCEILRDTLPDEPLWTHLWDQLATEEDDARIVDTIVPAIRRRWRERKQALAIMMENVHQVFEVQIKDRRSIAALRGFLMEDNGCLLIATAPLHFGAVTDPSEPFFEFFDIQVLDQLTDEETVELIRRNLEWEKRGDLLAGFDDLRPRILALYRMTGGSPRLSLMLYELIAHESVTAVRRQFEILLDRITPFYQDRMNELGPQERAVLETIALLRDEPRTPAAIAARMRLKQQQVSSILGRLSKAHYLTSHENPDDRRSRIYMLREGFFDIWLAMNNSRGARARLPFLVDFFARFYPTIEARNRKRAEMAQRLLTKADPAHTEDLTDGLDYLSEVGTEMERAAGKIHLAAIHSAAGNGTRGSLYAREARSLIPDRMGHWIADRASEIAAPDYLSEVEKMIACWEASRTGGLEALAVKLREFGGELSLRSWSAFRIDFLREHIGLLPAGETRIFLHLKVARLLKELARFADAEREYRDALKLAQELGDEPLAARSMQGLGQLLINMARFAEAEPLIRQALTIHEKRYGGEHPAVAADLNNMFSLLQSTNRLEEAEPLIRRALAIDEKSYSGEHSAVAIDLSNLAQLLHATNRREEAEPLMRRALAIVEKRYGGDHPSVAIRLNNLATLLHATNRLGEAEPLMRRALAIDETSYGGAHPRVATRLNNLAQLLHVTNRRGEAEPLMRRALAIDEESYGAEHPRVANRLNNLAQLLKATNRLEEAEPLMRRALAILVAASRGMGSVHPNQEVVVSNYTLLLKKIGRTENEIHDAISKLTAGAPDANP